MPERWRLLATVVDRQFGAVEGGPKFAELVFRAFVRNNVWQLTSF
jgi:hypothetical protein